MAGPAQIFYALITFGYRDQNQYSFMASSSDSDSSVFMHVIADLLESGGTDIKVP